MTTIAITGANGYLGSILCTYFRQRGDNVIALTRHKTDEAAGPWRRFELGSPLAPDLFDGVDVVIHTAWDLGNSDAHAAWRRNVEGSRHFLNAAHDAHVSRAIFVSSMSAFDGTRQTYGLMKLAVERTALDHHFVVARPGLVYGPGARGMAATLEKIAGLPLWPNFPGARLFLAHHDDLCTAIGAVVDRYEGFAGQIIGLANRERVDLPTIFRALSNRSSPRVPIPAPLVMLALRVVEKLGVTLPFRSDSLLGLVKATDQLPGQEFLAAANIEFRPLAAASSF